MLRVLISSLDMQEKRNHIWHNWSGNFSSRPELFFKPKTRAQLVSIVKKAIKNQKRIRVQGASRSFSAVVYSDDYLVSLENYNQIIQIDCINHTVTCQAGILLGDLFSILKKHGLSFSNCGVIDKMTLAGAISTGTHGSGISHSILSSRILSLEIITGKAEILTLDKSNSDVFNAACVSIGALGILCEIKMQLEPLFYLQSKEYSMDFLEMLGRMKSMALKSEYIKFWWFPHTSKVHVFEIDRINKEEVQQNNSSFFNPIQFIVYKSLDRITGPLFKMTHHIAGLTKWINRLSRMIFFSNRIRTGPATDILVVDEAVPMIVSEFALPFDGKPNSQSFASDQDSIAGCINRRRKKNPDQKDHNKAIQNDIAARALYDFRKRLCDEKLTLHFPVDIRFAASDDLWLSACYKQRSVYIGMCVRQYNKEKTPRIMELFQNVMLEYGARPHWGKLSGMLYVDFVKAFPKWIDFLKIKKNFDPDNVFSNHYLDQWFFEKAQIPDTKNRVQESSI